MRQLTPATSDRLAALERLVADDIPVLEAINRVQWTIQGAYMALRHVPATGSRDELRRELSRLIGAIKRKTLAETHGTRNCYQAGCRCDACRAAHTDARRRERAVTAPCGTDSAYRRHYSRGETPCDACREAHSAESARIKAARRSGPEEPVLPELERVIRTRLAVLAPVKSWAARERAAELRLLLTQITQDHQKDVA